MAFEELKRRPSEIVARYLLEPTLKEVYVEGITDKIMIQLFLEHENLTDVLCYEISTIDFSEEFTTRPELKSNKEKLLFLAKDILGDEDPIKLRVRCIVDVDFDIVFDVVHKSDFIISSDFSCLEGYILDDFVFKKVLKIGLTNFPVPGNVILNELFKVLNDLFFIRCARIALGEESLKMLEIDSVAKINKDGSIDFSLEDYLKKFAQKNRIANSKVPAYLKAINQLKSENKLDRRYYFNGHDFKELFFKYVCAIKNTAKFKFENFEKVLHISIEFSALKKYSLFSQLSAVYK